MQKWTVVVSADNSEKKIRVSHRAVTLRSLTPNNNGGYTMAGDTAAEVEIDETGIRIRTKGKRETWRFMPWAEVWINAAEEG